MKLTRTERWILSNQYRILEALYPDERGSLEKARIALESGYELEYDGMSQRIYKDTLSEDDCTEVHDILQMFSNLKYAYEQLSEKPEVDAWQIGFEGFDGNNEPEQLAYARYLCEDGEHYKDLHVRNSHSPTLDRYRRQLEVWKSANNRLYLTKAEIEQIALKAIHPTTRN